MELLHDVPADMQMKDKDYVLLKWGFAAELSGLKYFTADEGTALMKLQEGANLYSIDAVATMSDMNKSPVMLRSMQEQGFEIRLAYSDPCFNRIFEVRPKTVSK
jgi:hypothetical protein